LLVAGVLIWFVTALLVYWALTTGGGMAPMLISSGSTRGLLVVLSGIEVTTLGRLVTREWMDIRRIRRALRALLVNWIVTLALAIILSVLIVGVAGFTGATTTIQAVLYLLLPLFSCLLTAAGFFVARSAVSQVT
jgi:hypothetical protein